MRVGQRVPLGVGHHDHGELVARRIHRHRERRRLGRARGQREGGAGEEEPEAGPGRAGYHAASVRGAGGAAKPRIVQRGSSRRVCRPGSRRRTIPIRDCRGTARAVALAVPTRILAPPLSSPAPTIPPPDRAYPNGVLVRRLFGLAWRHPREFLLVLGLQALLLSFGLAGVNFIGLGIDYVRALVDPRAPDPAWWPGFAPPAAWTPYAVLAVVSGLILGTALFRSLLNYLYAVAVARLVHERMLLTLRTELYDHLQRLSFRFFDTHGSGALINRVIGDVQAIRVFVEGVMLQSVILVLSLVVYLAYMLWVSPPLTAACLASTPLLWLLSYSFSRRVRPLYLQSRAMMDDLYRDLGESIQGVQTIKGFAREAWHRERFRRINGELRAQQRDIFRRVSRFSPSIGFLSQLNIFILLAYGGWLVLDDRLPLGSGLVVFASLLQQFSAQVSKVAEIANSAQQSLTSARRLFEILDAPVEIRSDPGAIDPGRLRGRIEFRHVSFAYDPAAPVLQDVSFTVEPGQCVALLGVTGSGKSTLLSLIPRFYDPTAGQVLIDGRDVRRLDLHALRRQVGLVFQESFLFSSTIGANIAFGHPLATPEQLERAASIAAAHEFIKDLPQGYDTPLGEAGVGLSGGQRQRLAIARAVLLEPPILLMDDPTAAIDPATEHEILEAMDRAIAGRTTFIVAHRISTLQRADLIIVLEHGRVVQLGRHDELVRVKGPYRRTAKLQSAAVPPLAPS
ncbi:MAG: ABC transporter ATP-binding protein [Opitutaceae bacterium]|nr:ABC transporter ATP-binding protein [Opitutaceae bacterium]